MTLLDDLLARGPRRDTIEFPLDSGAVSIEFQALSPVDYERLSAAHTAADGTLDRAALTPALAAACAVDETAQDVEQWTQLTTSVLNAGEASALFQRLLMLNFGVPSGRVPKG